MTEDSLYSKVSVEMVSKSIVGYILVKPVFNVLKCGWYGSSWSFMQFEIVEEYILII